MGTKEVILLSSKRERKRYLPRYQESRFSVYLLKGDDMVGMEEVDAIGTQG